MGHPSYHFVPTSAFDRVLIQAEKKNEEEVSRSGSGLSIVDLKPIPPPSSDSDGDGSVVKATKNEKIITRELDRVVLDQDAIADARSGSGGESEGDKNSIGNIA